MAEETVADEIPTKNRCNISEEIPYRPRKRQTASHDCVGLSPSIYFFHVLYDFHTNLK
jgi:hypothetical protein